MKINLTGKTAELFPNGDGTVVVMDESTLIPLPRITCRVCGMVDQGNQDAVLLCGFCLEDLDKTRAVLKGRLESVFARLERNDQAWKTALSQDARVAQWWEQAQDRTDLHEKALAAGGRGAALVQAYRRFCAEFDACSAELERIHLAQTQVNTASLNEVGVF